MRTTLKAFLATAAVALASFAPVKAHASSIGDPLSLTYYYPNATTLYYTGTAVGNTSSTPEFTINPTGFTFMTVDVTATQIITNFLNTGTFVPGGSFIGYYLSDLVKGFNGVSIDSSSTSVNPTQLLLTTNGQIGLNFSGMQVTSGQKLVLNYSNAAAAVTPEPSSLLLIGTGLVGIVGAARRRFAL